MTLKLLESSTLSILTNYLSEKTLVVLDLDNTLFAPKGDIGSQQWVDDLFNRFITSGMGRVEAFALANKIWKHTQSHVQVQLLENNTIELIQTLKTQKGYLLGLTAREPGLYKRTQEQMQELGIDLTTQEFPKEEHRQEEGISGLLSAAVLYQYANRNKGVTLQKIIEWKKWDLERLIFVDDRIDNILSVAQVMADMRIPCVAIRYSGADHRLEAYNKEHLYLEEEALKEKDSHIAHLLLNQQDTRSSLTVAPLV